MSVPCVINPWMVRREDHQRRGLRTMPDGKTQVRLGRAGVEHGKWHVRVCACVCMRARVAHRVAIGIPRGQEWGLPGASSLCWSTDHSSIRPSRTTRLNHHLSGKSAEETLRLCRRIRHWMVAFTGRGVGKLGGGGSGGTGSHAEWHVGQVYAFVRASGN